LGNVDNIVYNISNNMDDKYGVSNGNMKYSWMMII